MEVTCLAYDTQSVSSPSLKPVAVIHPLYWSCLLLLYSVPFSFLPGSLLSPYLEAAVSTFSISIGRVIGFPSPTIRNRSRVEPDSLWRLPVLFSGGFFASLTQTQIGVKSFQFSNYQSDWTELLASFFASSTRCG